jgi:hypothetical protein
MLKHILVVHESMTVSTIINNYVMSELSNVSITECDSPIQSLEELDDTCFIIPQVNQTIKNKFLIPRSKG